MTATVLSSAAHGLMLWGSSLSPLPACPPAHLPFSPDDFIIITTAFPG